MKYDIFWGCLNVWISNRVQCVCMGGAPHSSVLSAALAFFPQQCCLWRPPSWLCRPGARLADVPCGARLCGGAGPAPANVLPPAWWLLSPRRAFCGALPRGVADPARAWRRCCLLRSPSSWGFSAFWSAPCCVSVSLCALPLCGVCRPRWLRCGSGGSWAAACVVRKDVLPAVPSTDGEIPRRLASVFVAVEASSSVWLIVTCA